MPEYKDLNEVKAAAYDTLAQIQSLQNQLGQLNKLIEANTPKAQAPEAAQPAAPAQTPEETPAQDQAVS